MVVVQRVVPPRSVLLLQAQQHGCQLGLELALLFRRQLFDAQGRIVVAEVVEVPGDLEPRFVRDGSLAADAEPAVGANRRLSQVLSTSSVIFWSPQSRKRQIAGLRPAEAAAGPVDADASVDTACTRRTSN